jgi:hypothetical protein
MQNKIVKHFTKPKKIQEKVITKFTPEISSLKLENLISDMSRAVVIQTSLMK